MDGRLQAAYPSFKLPRRGHFFAARSAKKRSLLRADSRQHVRRILWPGWRRSATMGVLKSVEPTGFLAFAPAFAGTNWADVNRRIIQNCPHGRGRVLSSALGSGFAGLGFSARFWPMRRPLFQGAYCRGDMGFPVVIVVSDAGPDHLSAGSPSAGRDS